VNMVFPLNEAEIRSFFKGKDRVFIVEDQDGFLENQIKFRFFNEISCPVHGKSVFPAYGDLDFLEVERLLIETFVPDASPSTGLAGEIETPERLGAFCEGCPHRATYFAIEQAAKECGEIVVGGDIGCSSLPPFRADWLLCMNAGIGIAQGMTQVLADQNVLSTGGDGSFFHGGLVSLLSAVQNRVDLLHLLFDNRAIAMTGHQRSPTSNESLDFAGLMDAIGVDRFYTVEAFEPKALTECIKDEIGRPGVRVIRVLGVCALRPDENRKEQIESLRLWHRSGRCEGCEACHVELGCPAIEKRETEPSTLFFDMARCTRCGACLEVCAHQAIGVDIT